MLDELIGQVSAPGPSGDWQADLRSYALSSRAALIRYRWVIDFIAAGPSFGPTPCAWTPGSRARPPVKRTIGNDGCPDTSRIRSGATGPAKTLSGSRISDSAGTPGRNGRAPWRDHRLDSV